MNVKSNNSSWTNVDLMKMFNIVYALCWYFVFQKEVFVHLNSFYFIYSRGISRNIACSRFVQSITQHEVEVLNVTILSVTAYFL